MDRSRGQKPFSLTSSRIRSEENSLRLAVRPSGRIVGAIRAVLHQIATRHAEANAERPCPCDGDSDVPEG